MLKSHSTRLGFIILCCILYLVLLVVLPLLGMEVFSMSTYAEPANASLDAHILWHIRVPRLLLAYCAGAILALSGMVFQTMFRNPLATPFTLGVSSGCSLGAAVYLLGFVNFSILGMSGITLFSFCGGLLASLIVFMITRFQRGFHSTYMLLAGVAVTLFFSSLVMLIQYMANFYQTFLIFRWLVGGLDAVSYPTIGKLLPVVIGGIIMISLYAKELDLLILGDEIATSKGIYVNHLKMILFGIVSFLISFIVALCGPIAFVGMIVPHICRLILGPKHRWLIIACVLVGGMFLGVSDTVARMVIRPSELPVGIITAALGGPFFLWVLVMFGKHEGFGG
ncbi:MAG: iron ABC transporter permease [Candidatus Auribacterota bacterium]|nr:iron ABC transporter permease [Candidatus Auribacterota bacterium]